MRGPRRLLARLLVALSRCARLAFPRSFRARWGGEMDASVRDAVTRALVREGVGSAIRVGVAEAWNTFARGLERRLKDGDIDGEAILAIPLQDVRLALRLIRRHPLHAVSVVATLALGIGGSTAIFSVVDNTLFRPMIVGELDRLVRIDDVARDGTQTSNVTPRNADALVRSATTLDPVLVQDYRPFVLTGDGDPEKLRGAGVSPGWARGLGVEPVLGRTFTPEEHRLGDEAPSALVSHALWQRRWGGSRDVVGATVTLNGRRRTVVGVMPAGFRFPYEADVWVPIGYEPADGLSHYLLVFGRRTEGRSVGDVRAELDALSARLADEHPATNADLRFGVVPLRDDLVRGYDRTALALLSVVGFLLLAGCLNVVTLSLARAEGRRREMTVRAALGASRRRRFVQLLLEAGLLVGLGALAGLGLVWLGSPYLALLVPPVLSGELAQGTETLSPSVLLFAGLVSLLALAITGGIPAARLVRASGGAGALRGARGARDRSESRTTRTLVALQAAVAMAVLVGAGSVAAGFVQDQTRPAGYDPVGVLTLRVTLPEGSHPDAPSRTRTVRQIQSAVAALPGVDTVAVTTGNPALGAWTPGVAAVSDPAEGAVRANLRFTTPGFFRTLDIPFAAGRDIGAADGEDGAPVVIVSRALARTLWPGEDAMGRTLYTMDPALTPVELTVVGVVEDVREESGRRGSWYVPYGVHRSRLPGQEIHLFVRGDGGVLPPATAVRQAVHGVDSDLPVFGAAPQTEVRPLDYALERAGAAVAGGFLLFGLLLAATGIFGTVSHALRSSRPALGVRKALGASAASILSSALSPVIGALAIGVAVGAATAAALGRLLGSVLPGLPDPGLGVVAVTALALTAVGVASALLPGLEAARVDPAQTLRDG